MAKRLKKKKQPQNLEQALFEAADTLRKNMDSSEYKHVVLGLIFLKYISDAFEELYNQIKNAEGEYERGDDPEDRDFYTAKNVFYVPERARWAYLVGEAKKTTQQNGSIKNVVNSAMDAIEAENPQLKNVLPREYEKENLDVRSLAKLIDHIGTFGLGTSEAQAKDLLGSVYEYFLGKFALAEGQKSGQFYTPPGIVGLLVEILQPYKGRIYDPCCGSGGMFVMSDKFVQAHQGERRNLSIYGQESNQTTWRLCRMNLALRGLNGTHVRWNTEGSFLRDELPDLKADFILANPPFNQDEKDWWDAKLVDDARWQFGKPPKSNANYAWIQHFIYHLSPKGAAGFVLSIGSLDSRDDADIRAKLVEENLVDAVVILPENLFYNTTIGACLWFIRRNKSSDETLFVDARKLKYIEGRSQRSLSEELMLNIAAIFRLHYGQKQDFLELVHNYLGRSNAFLSDFHKQVETAYLLFADALRQLEHFWAQSPALLSAEKQAEVLDFQLVAKIEQLHNDITALPDAATTFFAENTDAWQSAFAQYAAAFDALQTDEMNRQQQHLTNQLLPLLAALPNWTARYESINTQLAECLDFIKTLTAKSPKLKKLWATANVFYDAYALLRTAPELTDTATQIQYFQQQVAWLHVQFPDAHYRNVKGMCHAAAIAEVREQGYVLTPARYVGIAEIEETEEDYAAKIAELQQILFNQMQHSVGLDADIRQSLAQLKGA